MRMGLRPNAHRRCPATKSFPAQVAFRGALPLAGLTQAHLRKWYWEARSILAAALDLAFQEERAPDFLSEFDSQLHPAWLNFEPL
jgi:hypothetical protein